jgi:CheY-like chemotaxis protein
LERAVRAGEPYPLALLDVMMPEMDGFTLAERIQQLPGGVTSVMLLSSSADLESARRCRDLGWGVYLIKPVRQRELRRAILAVLGTAPLSGAGAQPRAPAPEAASKERRLRVLVAEDNAVNQKLILRLLQRRGHEVTLAVNGIETVALAGSREFDLILMDLEMPELDGAGATRRIRQDEAGRGQRIPIIALTAHALEGVEEQCLAAGMDAYLAKPIQSAELYAALQRFSAPTAEAAGGTPVGR